MLNKTERTELMDKFDQFLTYIDMEASDFLLELAGQCATMSVDEADQTAREHLVQASFDAFALADSLQSYNDRADYLAAQEPSY